MAPRKRGRTTSSPPTSRASSPSVPPTTSRTSSPSVPSVQKPFSEREKFDAAYETSTKSDVEVLGKSQLFCDIEFLTVQNLAAQCKTWTSKVYNHYKMPPDIVRSGNNVKYIFVCRRFVKQLLDYAYNLCIYQ